MLGLDMWLICTKRTYKINIVVGSKASIKTVLCVYTCTCSLELSLLSAGWGGPWREGIQRAGEGNGQKCWSSQGRQWMHACPYSTAILLLFYLTFYSMDARPPSLWCVCVGVGYALSGYHWSPCLQTGRDSANQRLSYVSSILSSLLHSICTICYVPSVPASRNTVVLIANVVGDLNCYKKCTLSQETQSLSQNKHIKYTMQMGF